MRPDIWPRIVWETGPGARCRRQPFAIVFAGLCRIWKEKGVRVTTISGETQTCCGVGAVNIRTRTGNSANIEALKKPLSFDLLLGYDAIRALGGVHITQMGAVQFQEKTPVCATLRIDQSDFSVEFDPHQKSWTASWRWLGNQKPAKLWNRVVKYHVPDQIRPAYEEELREWIKDGWLIPYLYKKLGPPQGLIPLMAVAQHNKAKVRPVMDYRELNAHVDAFTADADVCTSKCSHQRLGQRNNGRSVGLHGEGDHRKGKAG